MKTKIKHLAITITSFSILLHCTFLTTLFADRKGVVTYYNSIPNQCPKSKGLKQKIVKPVYSDKELIQHYGISFQVKFRDKISPTLYGALYYQNNSTNRYCMALPDGRFASFHNSSINGKNNLIQEICYPLKKCE